MVGGIQIFFVYGFLLYFQFGLTLSRDTKQSFVHTRLKFFWNYTARFNWSLHCCSQNNPRKNMEKTPWRPTRRLHKLGKAIWNAVYMLQIKSCHFFSSIKVNFIASIKVCLSVPHWPVTQRRIPVHFFQCVRWCDGLILWVWPLSLHNWTRLFGGVRPIFQFLEQIKISMTLKQFLVILYHYIIMYVYLGIYSDFISVYIWK